VTTDTGLGDAQAQRIIADDLESLRARRGIV
jgi:hypothetical protein